ncbi:MAG: GNAT family N-acetyltransferase, partial [Alphaproteobacteria bacterium]|nr:GNAT family N-acetyltransferase [Alphaproteobacteria bacterium]
VYRTLVSPADLRTLVDAVGYPFIIRPLPPARRIGTKKAVIVEHASELEDAQKCLSDCDGKWLVQRYISGPRHDVFFASQAGKVLSSMQVEYLRTDHVDGTGLCVSGKVVELQNTVADPTDTLVRELNYTGIGCAQYVIDPETGNACLLEINPRTSALHKVQEQVGLGFSELAVSLANGNVKQADIIAGPTTTGQKFVWSYGELRGIKSAVLKKEIGVGRAFEKLTKLIWSGIQADMHLTWSWRDPLPTLLLYVDQLRLKKIGKLPVQNETRSLYNLDVTTSAHRNPNTLSWKCFDNFSQAYEAWRHLEKVSDHSPFQKFEWLQSYYTTFDSGDETELAIMVGENEDGVPVALLPLCIRKRWGVRTLEWIGQHLNDYNAPIVASQLLGDGDRFATAQAWDDIIARIGGVDVISLLRQPCVLSGMQNPFAHFSSDIEASSAHALKLGSDWPSFAKSTFSKSTLRRLKEKSRKLSKQGHVSYTWHRSQEDRDQAVSRILEWKCQQLVATGARNAFEDRRSTEFLTRAADSCGDALQIITLDLDGFPIAGIITLTAGNGPIIYVMAYDQGPHSRSSPGMILLHHVIETAINDNQKMLDFSVGDEPYKVALCNSKTEMRQTIKGCSAQGKIVAKLLQGRLRLKRKIKQSDSMMKLLQRGNRWRGQFKNIATRPV